MIDDAPLAYEAGTPSNWEEGVAAFSITGEGEAMQLEGPCPRCAHRLSKSLAFVPVPAFNGGERKPTGVRVRCNCVEGHAGAGGDVRGCGAEGVVMLRL